MRTPCSSSTLVDNTQPKQNIENGDDHDYLPAFLGDGKQTLRQKVGSGLMRFKRKMRRSRRDINYHLHVWIWLPRPRSTNTHTHIYIYIYISFETISCDPLMVLLSAMSPRIRVYIYICVCEYICVCVSEWVCVCLCVCACVCALTIAIVAQKGKRSRWFLLWSFFFSDLCFKHTLCRNHLKNVTIVGWWSSLAKLVTACSTSMKRTRYIMCLFNQEYANDWWKGVGPFHFFFASLPCLFQMQSVFICVSAPEVVRGSRSVLPADVVKTGEKLVDYMLRQGYSLPRCVK